LKRIEDELVMVREIGGNLRQEGGVAVTAEGDPNNELEEHNKSLLLDCISHNLLCITITFLIMYFNQNKIYKKK
jgi:hypothetical protein